MYFFVNQVTISNEVNSSQLKYKIGANGFLIITAPPVSGKIGFDEFKQLNYFCIKLQKPL